jgi:hypothetical protein
VVVQKKEVFSLISAFLISMPNIYILVYVHVYIYILLILIIILIYIKHELLFYLSIFITAGKTYPQEGPVTLETFLSYFLGATCILGIVSSSPSSSSTSEEEPKSLEDPNKDSPSEEITVENAVGGRGWEECLVGCYYM